MMSASEIVARTEAMFDFFNSYFYSREPINLGFAFAASNGFTRRKITTYIFCTRVIGRPTRREKGGLSNGQKYEPCMKELITGRT